MIVYADTSQIIKLFLDEAGSDQVHDLFRNRDRLASSVIAYAECRAALAQARRMSRLTHGSYHSVLVEFEARWRVMQKMDVSSNVIQLAGDLAEKHALRGYDAIHLASAVTLQRDLQEPVLFSAADQPLLEAAKAEGLSV